MERYKRQRQSFISATSANLPVCLPAAPAAYIVVIPDYSQIRRMASSSSNSKLFSGFVFRAGAFQGTLIWFWFCSSEIRLMGTVCHAPLGSTVGCHSLVSIRCYLCKAPLGFAYRPLTRCCNRLPLIHRRIIAAYQHRGQYSLVLQVHIYAY